MVGRLFDSKQIAAGKLLKRLRIHQIGRSKIWWANSVWLQKSRLVSSIHNSISNGKIIVLSRSSNPFDYMNLLFSKQIKFQLNSKYTTPFIKQVGTRRSRNYRGLWGIWHENCTLESSMKESYLPLQFVNGQTTDGCTFFVDVMKWLFLFVFVSC